MMPEVSRYNFLHEKPLANNRVKQNRVKQITVSGKYCPRNAQVLLKKSQILFRNAQNMHDFRNYFPIMNFSEKKYVPQLATSLL